MQKQTTMSDTRRVPSRGSLLPSPPTSLPAPPPAEQNSTPIDPCISTYKSLTISPKDLKGQTAAEGGNKAEKPSSTKGRPTSRIPSFGLSSPVLAGQSAISGPASTTPSRIAAADKTGSFSAAAQSSTLKSHSFVSRLPRLHSTNSGSPLSPTSSLPSTPKPAPLSRSPSSKVPTTPTRPPASSNPKALSSTPNATPNANKLSTKPPGPSSTTPTKLPLQSHIPTLSRPPSCSSRTASLIPTPNQHAPPAVPKLPLPSRTPTGHAPSENDAPTKQSNGEVDNYYASSPDTLRYLASVPLEGLQSESSMEDETELQAAINEASEVTEGVATFMTEAADAAQEQTAVQVEEDGAGAEREAVGGATGTHSVALTQDAEEAESEDDTMENVAGAPAEEQLLELDDAPLTRHDPAAESHPLTDMDASSAPGSCCGDALEAAEEKPVAALIQSPQPMAALSPSTGGNTAPVTCESATCARTCSPTRVAAEAVADMAGPSVAAGDPSAAAGVQSHLSRTSSHPVELESDGEEEIVDIIATPEQASRTQSACLQDHMKAHGGTSVGPCDEVSAEAERSSTSQASMRSSQDYCHSAVSEEHALSQLAGAAHDDTTQEPIKADEMQEGDAHIIIINDDAMQNALDSADCSTYQCKEEVDGCNCTEHMGLQTANPADRDAAMEHGLCDSQKGATENAITPYGSCASAIATGALTGELVITPHGSCASAITNGALTDDLVITPHGSCASAIAGGALTDDLAITPHGSCASAIAQGMATDPQSGINSMSSGVLLMDDSEDLVDSPEKDAARGCDVVAHLVPPPMETPDYFDLSAFSIQETACLFPDAAYQESNPSKYMQASSLALQNASALIAKYAVAEPAVQADGNGSVNGGGSADLSQLLDVSKELLEATKDWVAGVGHEESSTGVMEEPSKTCGTSGSADLSALLALTNNLLDATKEWVGESQAASLAEAEAEADGDKGLILTPYGSCASALADAAKAKEAVDEYVITSYGSCASAIQGPSAPAEHAFSPYGSCASAIAANWESEAVQAEVQQEDSEGSVEEEFADAESERDTQESKEREHVDQGLEDKEGAEVFMDVHEPQSSLQLFMLPQAEFTHVESSKNAALLSSSGSPEQVAARQSYWSQFLDDMTGQDMASSGELPMEAGQQQQQQQEEEEEEEDSSDAASVDLDDDDAELMLECQNDRMGKWDDGEESAEEDGGMGWGDDDVEIAVDCTAVDGTVQFSLPGDGQLPQSDAAVEEEGIVLKPEFAEKLVEVASGQEIAEAMDRFMEAAGQLDPEAGFDFQGAGSQVTTHVVEQDETSEQPQAQVPAQKAAEQPAASKTLLGQMFSMVGLGGTTWSGSNVSKATGQMEAVGGHDSPRIGALYGPAESQTN